ncbi:MAG TPA: two-component regulator propeller domain-containing protein [bacterium]|nr:two-component regulator propeller domain-containing protein [bacterium]HQI48588.1 two-component regulator propeller domain-containing protein [bacterium]HQJ63079.1 two-component regulator propeller domain-containing protein [bacterium]
MTNNTKHRRFAFAQVSDSSCCVAVAVLSALLICSVSAFAQDRAFRFESLTTADGLSSNHITCIYQDHLGYLWIGTVDGLNRYDGEEVLNWYHHPLDSSSIYCNSITCIFEDREHRFWVATQHAVNLMDRSTSPFSSRPLRRR